MGATGQAQARQTGVAQRSSWLQLLRGALSAATRRAYAKPMTTEGTPLTTVGALAVSPDGRVLLVQTHKWRDTWGVPGGKVEYGETLKAALQREFLEETGLSLSNIYWGPVQEAVRSPEFYKEAHFILLNFVALTQSTTVTLNDEAQAYVWVTPEDALELPLNTPTRVLVEFYLRHRSLEGLGCL